MSVLYPRTLASINSWAREHSIPVNEARARFAQYGVLRAIADSNELSRILVFKGGNALDFVWHPNRSTRDLDFSALESSLTEEGLRPLLQRALDVAGQELEITFRVQSIHRNPPGEDRTFPTYQIKVGYALRDDNQRLHMQIKNQEAVSQVVPVEISINEVVCDFQGVDFDGINDLKVSTREDIVAEKLRALLQQLVRNRSRKQDLLDLAVQLKSVEALDARKVATYLQAKAVGREVVVAKSTYRTPEVWTRAGEDYESLKATARNEFVPFTEAQELVLGFVDTLQIPN